MTVAMDASPPGSFLASTPSTPSLSSTPLVSHSNSIGSAIDGGASAPSTIAAPDTPVALSFFASSFPISPSGFKLPSIRSVPSNVSPATNKTVLAVTQSASVTSSHFSTSLSAHLTASPPATVSPSPLTTVTSSATRLPSLSSSPPPKSTGFSSPPGSKSAPSSAISSKTSVNSTTGLGSNSVPLPHPITSNATNATSSIPARVNGSTSTHTFVPQVSTSDTLPFRLTTPEPSPTSNTLNNIAKSSGFFANRGAVAGVFVVVALTVLGLAVLLFFGLKRYFGSRHDSTREPTLPELEPSYHSDMHYRRASQMRALGNFNSADASRPLSGHSIASEESHAFSRDTHRSTDPIITPSWFPIQHADAGLSQGYAQGYTNGPNDMIPFPPPTKPFADQSKVSVQSAVESSPSIYPPTLPSVAGVEEENYWRQQGFERIADPQVSDRIEEKRTPQQQLTPPESMLGLWCNGSQSTIRRYSSSEENELIRSLDPRMEPTSVHKGSTAPIASPPRWQLHDE